MPYVTRTLQESIQNKLFQKKAIILYGARQTGKTTLVEHIRSIVDVSSLYLNCDEIDIRQGLSNKTSTELAGLLRSAKLVIIDEAQRVENIGLTVKILVENFPDKQFLITGSSSFELSDRVKEPLTGRAFEFHLYPFSLAETASLFTPVELPRTLEERVILGMYPEVVISNTSDILAHLADSYLYKDIFTYSGIRNHDVLLKLLQALALQIGQEVSYTELGQTVGIDKKTAANYVNILEQAFVIFHLPPFSRNLRNELKKHRKIYFYDTGIRNALINNFNPLSLRTDKGGLFENFIIAERIKNNANHGRRKNYYFWRTHQQQELDLLEEAGGQISAYEIKLSRKNFKPPKSFCKAYPDAAVRLVNRDNCLDFLL